MYGSVQFLISKKKNQFEGLARRAYKTIYFYIYPQKRLLNIYWIRKNQSQEGKITSIFISPFVDVYGATMIKRDVNDVAITGRTGDKRITGFGTGNSVLSS